MGQWFIDTQSRPGVIQMRLEGFISEDEMRAFHDAHNAAIDACEGADYRVLCDIRQMRTLSPEAAAWMEKAKAYSSAHLNFQGSAVLVASSIAALQHKRTSASSGVIDSELITEDERAAWTHLATVRRQ